MEEESNSSRLLLEKGCYLLPFQTDPISRPSDPIFYKKNGSRSFFALSKVCSISDLLLSPIFYHQENMYSMTDVYVTFLNHFPRGTIKKFEQHV